MADGGAGERQEQSYTWSLQNLPVRMQITAENSERIQRNLGRYMQQVLNDGPGVDIQLQQEQQLQLAERSSPDNARHPEGAVVLNISGDGDTEPDENQNTNVPHGNEAAHTHSHNAGGGGGMANSSSILRTLWKVMEGSLAFILLLTAKLMYNHRLGILVLGGLLATFYHANSKMQKIAHRREDKNCLKNLKTKGWIILFLSVNIAFVYYIFEEQKLYQGLYFVLPEVGPIDVWNLVWVIGMNDFNVKMMTIVLKATVASFPHQVLAYKKKGKYYMLLEYFSQFYRCLLPITPWIYFLQDDTNGGRFFSVLLLVIFFICKVQHVLQKANDLRKAFLKFKVDVSYGICPSKKELDELSSCAICQDDFTDPVKLSCGHIFCEDCVSMWFDRDKTCPMCRANIVDNPTWRDGSTDANIQLY